MNNTSIYIINKQHHTHIQDILFALFIIYAISGFNGALHNYILFSLFLTFLFFAFICNIQCMGKALFTRQSVMFIIFLIYYFISSIINTENNLSYAFTYIGMFMIHYGSIWYFEYYYQRNDIKTFINLINLTIITWMIFCIKAILFYSQNMYAARELASNYDAFGTLSIGGGYSLAFGSALLFICFFDAWITKDINSKKRVWFIICMVILATLVIKTESSITVIAMFIGIIISCINRFYHGTTKKDFNQILTIMIFILIALIIYIFINEIGQWIVNITQNRMDDIILKRLYRIGEKFKYYGTDISNINYVDVRWDTVKTSWQTFSNNILIGVGYKCGNIYSLMRTYGVGQHSEFVDALASYGIIGGIPLILVYISSIFSNIKRKLSSQYSYIIPLIFMCICNPFQTFHSCFSVFFLIPAISVYTEFEKSKYINN